MNVEINPSEYKVLIVDDVISNVLLLKVLLTNEKFNIVTAGNGTQALEQVKKEKPDLVLLDVMMPDISGFEVAQQMKADEEMSEIPVIFLTALNSTADIVKGFQVGGNDFISKPFNVSVLLAKIQAILRRTYDMPNGISILEHKGIILNLNDFTLSYRDKSMELTKNEFRILETLLVNKGKIVSRDTLMMKLWQDDNYVEENTLTVNVTRLRKKLEDLGIDDFIKTKVGCGYIIEL